MFCIVVFEPWTPPLPVLDCLRLPFTKGIQGVCGGAEEICVGFRPWSVAGSLTRKEERIRSFASGHAILAPGEPAIQLRCPKISRWCSGSLHLPLRVQHYKCDVEVTKTKK